MSYKWVEIGCTLNDKLMMIIIKYKMTGNESREKVLRSIFYPGASLHPCLFEKKTTSKWKTLINFTFLKFVWKKMLFHLKSFATEVFDLCTFLYRSYFVPWPFYSLHALLKVWHNNKKKYKWQIDCTLYNCTYIFRSCKCSIHSVILIVTCTKKVSHIIYIPLSRKRKDMNNSSNLHVSAVSCLLYLPKSELAIASSKIISSTSMQITFLRD